MATKKKKTINKKAKQKTVSESSRTEKSAKLSTKSPSINSKQKAIQAQSNVQQPMEDVMAEEYPNNPKAFQDVLRRLCTDSKYREDCINNPKLLATEGLNSNQLAILIMIGKETGHYNFQGMHPGLCCCCD